MKYIRSETQTVLENLPLTKTRIHVKNEDVEGIWIRYDAATNKMWLQNNSLNLPYRSWGLELDYSTNLDLSDTLEKAEYKVHPEAFEAMINLNMIDNQGNLI